MGHEGHERSMVERATVHASGASSFLVNRMTEIMVRSRSLGEQGSPLQIYRRSQFTVLEFKNNG
jgi:hypothetical protein